MLYKLNDYRTTMPLLMTTLSHGFKNHPSRMVSQFYIGDGIKLNVILTFECVVTCY